MLSAVNQIAERETMASAAVSDQLQPQLNSKDKPLDLSVHMDFAYRSDLKQFSDRVIRVQVQREPLEGKALQHTSQAYDSACVALQELSDCESKHHAIDLEMQPVAQSECEDNDDSQSKHSNGR